MALVRAFVRLKAEPLRDVLCGCLKHIFARGGTGSFQTVQDASHQHEAIFAIATAKCPEWLWWRSLIGPWNQMKMEYNVKVNLDCSIHQERPSPPGTAAGVKEIGDDTTEEIHTSAADSCKDVIEKVRAS